VLQASPSTYVPSFFSLLSLNMMSFLSSRDTVSVFDVISFRSHHLFFCVHLISGCVSIYTWGWPVWSGTPTSFLTYRVYNISESFDFFITYSTRVVLAIHRYFDYLPYLKRIKSNVFPFYFSKMNFYRAYSV